MENQNIESKRVRKGEIIFNEGDYESCMYDIQNGKVGIYVDYGKDTEKMLTELKPGEFFGEMGMLECCLRSATAVSLADDTQVHIITPETFSSYFQENPDKIFQIMQHMSKRIRELTNDYMEACHTIAEAVEAEKAGKEKSSGLKARLKRFARAYIEASDLAAKANIQNPSSMFLGTWYW